MVYPDNESMNNLAAALENAEERGYLRGQFMLWQRLLFTFDPRPFLSEDAKQHWHALAHALAEQNDNGDPNHE